MFPFIKKEDYKGEDYKGEDTVVCCISVQNSIFFFVMVVYLC